MNKYIFLIITVLTLNVFSVINSRAQSPYGSQVGLTYYDLPSNASGVNRLSYNEDDQSVSISWIQSITALAQPTFERGAGYNHLSNGTWQYGTDGECRVNNGCSGEYSGWMELINFPSQLDNSSNLVTPEVIISHSGGLKRNTRSNRGTGSWSAPTKLLFDQDHCASGSMGNWPRAVRSGNSMIHMIATHAGSDLSATLYCPNSGTDKPFLYNRSSDKGVTWDIQNQVLPGLGTTNPIFTAGAGDEYQIAARDNYVAILAGGNNEPWTLWKSSDYGATWDYHIISYFDINRADAKPGFFNTGETGLECSDRSHAVAISSDGTVHCFTGVVMNAADEVTGDWTGQATFGNSGIWYWNDKFPNFCNPVVIADLVDLGSLDGSGNFIKHTNPIYSDNPSFDPFDAMSTENGGYFASSTTMPAVAVKGNNIYVTYSADVEGTAYGASGPSDPSAIPYKDIYMVWSNDGGNTWSYELNVASDIAGYDDGSGGTGIEEDVFPDVQAEIGSDNMLHIVWNMDYKPGSDVTLDNGQFSQQYISYYGVNVNNLVFNGKTSVSSYLSSFGPVLSQGDTAINTGDTVYIDLLEGQSATFSPSTAVTSIGDTAFKVYPTATTNYSVESDLINACGTLTEDLTITSLGAALGAIIVEDTIYACAGETVTIEGYGTGMAGNYGYLWDDPLNTTTSSLTLTAASSGTYTLTVSHSGASSVQDQVYLKVYSTPTISISGAGSYCEGDMVTLTASGASTYAWDSPVANGIPFEVTSSNTYNVTGTDANGCSSTTSASITVVAGSASFTGLASSYCENNNAVTLTGSPSGGTFSGNGVTGSSFDPSSAGAGNQTLVYTVSISGCNFSDIQSVEVKASPDASITNLLGAYCVSSPDVIMTPATNGGVFSGATGTSSVFSPSTLGAGNYIVKYDVSNAAGCSASSTNNVQVVTAPSAQIIMNNSYCSTESPVTVLLSPSGGLLTGPGVSGTTFDPGSANIGSNTLIYYFVAGGGCNANDTMTVDVIAGPTGVSFSGLPSSICEGSNAVNLSGTPSGGNFAGSGITGSTFDPGVDSGTYSISYTYTNSGGCSAVSTQNVSVLASPTVSIQGISSNGYCASDPDVTLTGSPSGGIFSGTGMSGNTFSPTVAGAGTHTVSYSYTNGQGCSGSASSQVTVSSSIPAKADFDTLSTDGLNATFFNKSTNSSSWQWDFGDGTTSNSQVPDEHTFPAEGTYNVCLTVSNACGSTDATCKNITVSTGPVGINEYDLGNLVSLFPNPNTGTFNLEISKSGFHHVQFQLTDVVGRKIADPVNISFTNELVYPFDATTVSNGIYYVQVIIDDILVTKRLTIKK